MATIASEGELKSLSWVDAVQLSAFFPGMNTTAGSFSLLGSVVPGDAGIVKRLRKAGAIILGARRILSCFKSSDKILYT